MTTPKAKRTPLNARVLRAAGFSLVELLSILAVVAVLAALAAPLMSAFRNTHGLSATAGDISSVVEAARAHAMAQNTHVWLGVRQEGDGIQVATVVSRDGSSDASSSNIAPLGSLRRYSNAFLASNLPPYGNRPNGTDDGVKQLAGAASAVSFTVSAPSGDVKFDRQIIQFSPRGEATLPQQGATRLERWIELGLQEYRGGRVLPGNSAAIQIAGITGQPNLFLP